MVNNYRLGCDLLDPFFRCHVRPFALMLLMETHDGVVVFCVVDEEAAGGKVVRKFRRNGFRPPFAEDAGSSKVRMLILPPWLIRKMRAVGETVEDVRVIGIVLDIRAIG